MGVFLRGLAAGAVPAIALVSLLRLLADSGTAADDVAGDEGGDDEGGDDGAGTASPAAAAPADSGAGGGAAAEEAAAAAYSDADLALFRESLLKAHPDVIPELVAGATPAELIASVEVAKAAFAAARDKLNADVEVPSGAGNRALPAGWESFSPEGKIQLGLQRRR